MKSIFVANAGFPTFNVCPARAGGWFQSNADKLCVKT